jgi:hypothetical protein
MNAQGRFYCFLWSSRTVQQTRRKVMKRLLLVFLVFSFLLSTTVQAEDEIPATSDISFEIPEPTISGTQDMSIYFRLAVLSELPDVYVDSYSIYVNDALYEQKEGPLSDTYPANYYQLPGILPNTEYKIQVKLFGGPDAWEASDSFTVKTPRFHGWYRSLGEWLYFDPAIGTDKKGWLKYNNQWYFLKDTYRSLEQRKIGTMVGEKQSWEQINGKWYYFNRAGVMQTGWIEYADGRGKKWYYLNPNGDMKTGWLLWNNQWYFLESYGGMATGWQSISGKWYYFFPGGTMAANTTVQGYKIGKDGAWIR